MSRGATILLVALLVLAGCGSPSGTGTNATSDGPDTVGAETPVSTSTPTPSTTASATGVTSTTTATTTAAPNTTIAVREGTLPVNATLVFERLRTVLDSDVRPPATVVVENGSSGFGATTVRPFWSAVGVTNAAPTGPPPVVENGYTTGFGTVVVAPGDDSNVSSVRMVLAHELVHYTQFAAGRGQQLQTALPRTTDGEFVTRALLEGAAVVTTDAYLDRYHPETRPNRVLYERIAAAYPTGSAQQYVNDQYVEGTEYVDGRLDSPGENAALYERPPLTGEQLVHGLSPEEEPALPLSVRVAASEYVEVGRDTLGEPFVRTTLAGAVEEDAATRAATGWGNDTLVTVRDGDAVGYAWTLRWDDAGNASEARDAFETRLSSLPAASRLVPVDEETFVVLLGDERFVEETTVSGEEKTVGVDTP
ncbi:hypothetical protein ACFPYI_05190 [Halomarina salina]|uniref:DUF4157 domain-containing protein n=1 Tax=Halomarina salina TaxID=1872699 RepID=A0ABD5RK80_9EURY|nr:hypothetical protein [Halomarina salina]